MQRLKEFYQTAIHNFTLGRVRFLKDFSIRGFKKTKIGELPYDWELISLERYSSLITNGFVGKATPYYTNKENGVRYLQGMNVRRNKLDLREITYVNHEFHNKQKKSQLKAGDILTVQSGHIGESAVVPFDLEGSNCHAVIITRLDKTVWNPKFVTYFLNSPKGRVKLEGITVGTTVAHINTSELKKFLVPKPSLIEQDKIVSKLEEIDSNIDKIKLKLEDTKKIQKGLVNEIF